ncbi:MAG: hypothetical protein HZA89_18340 [Verrucomicrobia bacterium]|nr:hypothetical protein [Verrucomicrobiota bacterium]
MSTEADLNFDLERLLLPAWAKQADDTNRYANHRGDPGPREGGDRRDRRGGPPRGGGRPGGGRDNDRGPRRPQGDRRSGPPRRDDARGPRREEPREPVAPPPEVAVNFAPEARGVEALARQIKLTGRAYPLFDIALLVLRKADRYVVTFSTIKKPDGTVAQPLFNCNLDETLWTSEAEAVAHALKKHFDTFYKAERTATTPPKGTYTFVAQCGMSGVILGPPNYHDYQKKLTQLHAERFGRMPFDMFKARVKIVRDEAVVKQWLDEQSWKTEYLCLNVAEEKKLATMEEVEKHFRETHLASIVKPVETQTINGLAASQMPCVPLRRLARMEWEALMRFPLKLVTALSQNFASQGLHFFKAGKGVTHVSVARPKHLDLNATPVSPGLRKLLEFIEAHPRCTRRKILQALAPAATPAPTLAAATPVEGVAPVVPAEVVTTPEQIAVVSDLHWLLHQGHVIEFASGVIEAARKPLPKPPPRPARSSVAPEASAETATMTASEETTAVSSEPEEENPPVQTEIPAPSGTAEVPAESATPVASPS